VIDEYTVGRLPMPWGSRHNRLCNCCTSRVDPLGEYAHIITALHESQSHLRDIIPDRIVWGEARCQDRDVSMPGGHLYLSSNYSVILGPVEILIEPLRHFRSVVRQLQGFRVRVQIQNLYIA